MKLFTIVLLALFSFGCASTNMLSRSYITQKDFENGKITGGVVRYPVQFESYDDEIKSANKMMTDLCKGPISKTQENEVTESGQSALGLSTIFRDLKYVKFKCEIPRENGDKT